MNREYHRWHSPRLDREMELLIFGHAGAKVLVFPTRDGRFHEYEELRITEWLRPKLEGGHLQLYCVDSLDHDALYCFWKEPAARLARHRQFESYILEEVFPLMHSKNAHPCTISHGLSLGAFHAANIAFRHPHRFQKLAAFSGRYDLTLNVESFKDLFDGYYDDQVYFNTPTHFLPNVRDDETLQQLRAMDIVLVIGEEDPFLENNRHLSTILWDKGVWNALHIWNERAHRGYYWRRMAPLYL